jgi:4'-phosphopantetheinyl transferase
VSAVRPLGKASTKAAAPGAVLQACSTGAMPSAWPGVRVLALFRTPEPEMAKALGRADARRLARQVLQEHAGQALATPCLELPRHHRGAQRVSISHDANLSLLAWCAVGTVGVDLVTLDSLAHASPQELVSTAQLYLGPEAAESVAAAAQASEARTRFAIRWADMEAKLKCLGLELDEWHPARARSLEAINSVPVQAVDANGQACTRWVGCVAWRRDALSIQRRAIAITRDPSRPG